MIDGPKQVVIQKNPLSGSGLREPQLLRLTDRLEALGLEPIVYGDREEILADLNDEEFRDRTRCIVAAGGDGTVDDLINRFPGTPLAVLAMGTENLLAKHYHIPRNGRLVADMIAAGHLRRVDLGLAGQHRFAVMASCGFDAEVVLRAHQRRIGRITKLHYLWPIVATMMRKDRPELVARSLDLDEDFHCEMVVVSNLSRYASNLPINPKASDNDGMLDVCLFRKARSLHLIGHSLQGFLTGRIQSENLYRFQTRLLKLFASEEVPIQADGDPIGVVPMEFRVLPSALDLIVPAQYATASMEEEFIPETAG